MNEIIDVLFLDAGHGNNTPGKRTPIFPDGPYKNKYMAEREFNHSVVTKMIELFKSYNVEIVYVSEVGAPEVSLADRTNKANKRYKELVDAYGKNNVNALFVSIHANAKDGVWNTSNGIETYYDTRDANGKKAATEVQKQLITATKLRDRGIKVANFHITRETVMTAILCECGFMDNLSEANLLISDSYRTICAKAIVKGIVNYMNLKSISNKIESASIEQPIRVKKEDLVISKPNASLSQCVEWAKSKKATPVFINNAEIYFKIASKIGVNPVFAYVQYGLESGYGYHKGIVPASYCNPCGLKTSTGGSDTDSNAHKKFKTWEEGISAHIDHIALYAGIKGYPKSNTYDPRHFKELYGKGKTIKTICENWCPSNKKYADIIIEAMNLTSSFKNNDYETAVAALSKKYINTPAAWKVPNEVYIEQLICNVCKAIYKVNTYKESVDKLAVNKVIDSPSIWHNKTYNKNHVRTMVIKLASLIN